MHVSLSELISIAQQKHIRIPAIITLNVSERDEIIKQLDKSLPSDETLIVSDDLSHSKTQVLPASKINTHLGTEVKFIIWDGHSGLSPSGLGAASGLIKGGGLLILLLPDLEELSRKPDPDYQRLCAFESELVQCSTHFLQKLIRLCDSEPLALKLNSVIEKGDDECRLFEIRHSQLIHDLPMCSAIELPTQDQTEAIDHIIKVSQGHRNRPLVITADRGRGKSSVLGLAAAKLVNDYQHKIIVTAPTKRAAAKVFEHYEKTSNFSNGDSNYINFVAPDELAHTLPDCHLLLIDEAAAIPNALLIKLSQHYKRIVFSSTIHGYEGNGRGFAIRFKAYLNHHYQTWSSIHLNQSIRWAANDPLEFWTARLLHLNASHEHHNICFNTNAPEFIWLSQTSLANDTVKFDQLMSLLVNAHYQTSPDDIRLILDHPGIHIGSLQINDTQGNAHIVGAVLLIEEGNIQDTALSKEILQGSRRIRGHLVPQSLATSHHNTELLSLKYLRVMRIAVAPEFENKGFGSQMISEALKFGKENQFDMLCTAFGLSNELINFWQKNHFRFLKLGTRKDNSTGTYSGILGLALSKHLSLNKDLQKGFSQHLLHGLSRQFRDHPASELILILSALDSKESSSALFNDSSLAAYAFGHRSLEDSSLKLAQLTMECCINQSIIERIDRTDSELLVSVILQARNPSQLIQQYKLSGKKELDKRLRQAVGKLISKD